MTRFIPAAIAALTVALPGAGALAGTQEDVAVCHTRLQAEASTDATFTFVSIRGASLKSIVFEMRTAEETADVICKVKRGQIVEIVWP